MEKSIEEIWKAGFLNEKSLVAPIINDLYNQKSKHLVARAKRLFEVNFYMLVFLALVMPIVHYFLDVLWQGVAASLLLLLIAWYNKRQLNGIKMLDQGATSLDYLKAFHGWLKDALFRGKKISRLYYPLCYAIALSTIWSTWDKQEELIVKTQQKFPGLAFVGNVPLVALIMAGTTTLLMIYFSDRIYKWDVRLMYGRVFSKLEETITEMEKLKEGDDGG